MLGAIIGDIVGSRFEWHNIKTKDFALFTDQCFPTDDTIMTVAIAQAYYGIPEGIGHRARSFLDPELLAVVDRFCLLAACPNASV